MFPQLHILALALLAAGSQALLYALHSRKQAPEKFVTKTPVNPAWLAAECAGIAHSTGTLGQL